MYDPKLLSTPVLDSMREQLENKAETDEAWYEILLEFDTLRSIVEYDTDPKQWLADLVQAYYNESENE
jgi:hypothetical protein